MATATPRTTSRPPFPLKKLTTQPWREQALTKIGEQRFALDWMSSQPECEKRITVELRQTIQDLLGRGRERREATLVAWRVRRTCDEPSQRRGDRAPPDRPVLVHLRPAPGPARARPQCMPKDDLRRVRLQEIVKKRTTKLEPHDRDLIVAAQQEAAVESATR